MGMFRGLVSSFMHFSLLAAKVMANAFLNNRAGFFTSAHPFFFFGITYLIYVFSFFSPLVPSPLCGILFLFFTPTSRGTSRMNVKNSTRSRTRIQKDERQDRTG